MQCDNSARRLHYLLHKAFDYADQSKAQKLTSTVVWAKVFEIDPNDAAKLEYCSEEFLFLLRCARREVQRLQVVKHEPYLRVIDFIGARIHQHGFWGGPWHQLGSSLKNPAMMDLLAVIADSIDSSSQLMALDKKDLDDLLNSINTLMEEVRNSNLENSFRTFLIVRLEELRVAIMHYSISGSEGLRNVVEANIGSILLKCSGLKPTQRQDAGVQKFVALMVRLGGLLGIAADLDGFLLPAMKRVFQQLPPGA